MSKSFFLRIIWFAMQYDTECLKFQQNSKCIAVMSSCHFAILAMRRIIPASATNYISPICEIFDCLKFVRDKLYDIV
jgi:hypothetical protein